jgi:hypothetical protein
VLERSAELMAAYIVTLQPLLEQLLHD